MRIFKGFGSELKIFAEPGLEELKIEGYIIRERCKQEMNPNI